jgi:hypothetical protein
MSFDAKEQSGFGAQPYELSPTESSLLNSLVPLATSTADISTAPAISSPDSKVGV